MSGNTATPANKPAAKAAPAAETSKPAGKVQPLMDPRMQECEFKRTLYVATAYENTRPEDLLDPEYWTHVAARLKPWDKIEVRADDGSWYAELLVLDTSRNWARVYLLANHDLTTRDTSLSQASRSEYEVVHRGPERKWSVLRKSDREVLHEGSQTEAAAFAWLAGHLKA